MTELQASVRIGPFDYQVLRPKSIDGGDTWGKFDAGNAVISIVAKVPTKIHAKEIFLHELLHGLWYHSGLNDKADEELIVRQLASSLMVFVRQHPWFLDWLKDA